MTVTFTWTCLFICKIKWLEHTRGYIQVLTEADLMGGWTEELGSRVGWFPWGLSELLSHLEGAADTQLQNPVVLQAQCCQIVQIFFKIF